MKGYNMVFKNMLSYKIIINFMKTQLSKIKTFQKINFKVNQPKDNFTFSLISLNLDKITHKSPHKTARNCSQAQSNQNHIHFHSAKTSRKQSLNDKDYINTFKNDEQLNIQTLTSTSKSIGYTQKQFTERKYDKNKERSFQKCVELSKILKKKSFQTKFQTQKIIRLDKLFSKQTSTTSKRSSCQKLIEQTKKTLLLFNEKKDWLVNELKKIKKQKKQRVSPLKNLDLSRISNKNINSLNFSEKFKYLKGSSQTSSARRSRKVNEQNFQIIKKLGSGTFATVYLAKQKETGFLVTLKKIKKSLLVNQKCQQQIITEIKIQMYVDHPNILKIYGCFIDHQHVTLILEFMQQGNLYKKLSLKHHFSQPQTSRIINQILFALNYLHQNKIIHRDIKPENIVLTHNIPKICDFGTAAIGNNRRITMCGTLDYHPPQLIQGQQYDASLDVWSMGILTYELLVGKPPFYSPRRKDTIKQIIQYRNGQVNYPRHLSLLSINFIARFLLKNPQERISIAQALNHKFVFNGIDQQTKQLRQKFNNFKMHK